MYDEDGFIEDPYDDPHQDDGEPLF